MRQSKVLSVTLLKFTRSGIQEMKLPEAWLLVEKYRNLNVSLIVNVGYISANHASSNSGLSCGRQKQQCSNKVIRLRKLRASFFYFTDIPL